MKLLELNRTGNHMAASPVSGVGRRCHPLKESVCVTVPVRSGVSAATAKTGIARQNVSLSQGKVR